LTVHEHVVQLQLDEQAQEEHDDVHGIDDDSIASTKRLLFEVESEDAMFDLKTT